MRQLTFFVAINSCRSINPHEIPDVFCSIFVLVLKNIGAKGDAYIFRGIPTPRLRVYDIINYHSMSQTISQPLLPVRKQGFR